jgi:hypothetical protein
MFTPNEKKIINYYRTLVKEHFQLSETIRVFHIHHLPAPYRKMPQILKAIQEKMGGVYGRNIHSGDQFIILQDPEVLVMAGLAFEDALTHELGHYIDWTFGNSPHQRFSETYLEDPLNPEDMAWCLSRYLRQKTLTKKEKKVLFFLQDNFHLNLKYL